MRRPARVGGGAGLIAAGVGALAAIAAAAAPGEPRTVWDGLYTPEQAERGAALYRRWCADCHAADLSGGELAPGLAGGEFVWNWNGLTAGQLFERIRISMPPADPSRVTRSEKADVLAHLLRANGFPAGARELAGRVEILDQFLLEAVRPEPGRIDSASTTEERP